MFDSVFFEDALGILLEGFLVFDKIVDLVSPVLELTTQ